MFQKMLRKGREDAPPDDVQLAKSPGNGRFGKDRRHFRHELGSALAVLEHAGLPEGETRDLAAYLAATHHGKVRLGIRSLPGARTETRTAIRIGQAAWVSGVGARNTARGGPRPRAACPQYGTGPVHRPDWDGRERTPVVAGTSLTLLERFGPFRLAYLEAIVRAADMRASKKEQEEAAK